MSLGCC